MNRRHHVVLILIVSSLSFDRALMAQATEFTNFAQWQSVAGPYTTIDFVNGDQIAFITNQYFSSGVIFTGGNDFVLCCSPTTLPQDGWGLAGGPGGTHLSFLVPVTSLAVHYPGAIQFQLLSDGQLLFTSGQFFAPGLSGTNGFLGIVSSLAFDSAIILDWADGVVTIDNLYFGPPIPGPSAAGAIVVACLIRPRRRRC